MKQPSRFLRFILGLGLVLLVLWIGFVILLTIIPTWGASPDENERTLPGDVMVANPVIIWGRTITNDAALERDYLWLLALQPLDQGCIRIVPGCSSQPGTVRRQLVGDRITRAMHVGNGPWEGIRHYTEVTAVC